MPETTATPPGTTASPAEDTPLPEADAQVVKQAGGLGKQNDLAEQTMAEQVREIDINRLNAARQFEQGVVSRRLDHKPGFGVGAFVAASSSIALAAKNSVAAVVLGAIATFGTESLTTLNAGQRKSQAIAAANAYREVEASGRWLRLEFPYAPLDFALSAVAAITTRRMSINKTAEPPSARALRRADVQERKRKLYGRRLSFTERHWLLFWDKKPPVLTTAHTSQPAQNPTGPGRRA